MIIQRLIQCNIVSESSAKHILEDLESSDTETDESEEKYESELETQPSFGTSSSDEFLEIDPDDIHTSISEEEEEEYEEEQEE